jgi:hypothetical protein
VCDTGFELRASQLPGRHSTTWAIPSTLFCAVYFWDRVLWTICLGCLRTMIFLISASWIARIPGVSHQAPSSYYYYFFLASPSLFMTNIPHPQFPPVRSSLRQCHQPWPIGEWSHLIHPSWE